MYSNDDTLFINDVPVAKSINLLSQHHGSEHTAQLGHKGDAQAQRKQVPSRKGLPKKRLSKIEKNSRHGISYPSFPIRIVKKLASSFPHLSGARRAKLNKEELASIVQASDRFFEQVGEDVGTYAHHAGRKTVDNSDVIVLLKRSSYRLHV